MLDRSAVELEYAKKLELVAARYSGGVLVGADERTAGAGLALLEFGSPSRSKGTSKFFSSTTKLLAPGTEREQENDTSPAAPPATSGAPHLFFTGMSFVARGNANRVREFSAVLSESLAEDADGLLSEVLSVLKDSRTVFRKNRSVVAVVQVAPLTGSVK